MSTFTPVYHQLSNLLRRVKIRLSYIPFVMATIDSWQTQRSYLFNKFFYITIGLLLPIFFVTLPSLGTDYRPSLVFREDWQETAPATPVTQEQLSNQNLILNLYGSGGNSIKKRF